MSTNRLGIKMFEIGLPETGNSCGCNMGNLIFKIRLMLLLHFLQFSIGTTAEDIASGLNSNRTLSRRKRYVVFPEGSSFQLVYCLTMPTDGGLTYFTFGFTAALAWELPHEPLFFLGKKDKEAANKRVDVVGNEVNISKPPVTAYHKPWTNWTMNSYSGYKITPSYVDKSHFIPIDHGLDDIPAYKSDKIYHKFRQVHRRTRRELYGKVEKFFMAQNKDGKACLLKALCEVNQAPRARLGTFMEEILKAVFTWHPDEDEERDEYDEASTYRSNCTERYPGCPNSLWNVL